MHRNPSLWRTSAAVVSAAASFIALSGITPASAGGSVSTPRVHVLRTLGHAAAASTATDLTYNGGPIQQTPAVYISWWGSQWASGFSTGGYTSATAQKYVGDYFGNVGGSSWVNSQTQYCQGVATGAASCPSTAVHVGNPTGILKGTWTDTTALPLLGIIQQSDVAAAAQRLAAHFGYNANATYFVFTPTGAMQPGFNVQWCAYHGQTTFSGKQLAFAYMPYMPDATTNCGQNFVNKTNDAYGHGYFDGFSIVGGHELAEAETDPETSGPNGWLDSSGNETGDKCAWNAASTNITLANGQFYAVQPLWSNSAAGCVNSG